MLCLSDTLTRTSRHHFSLGVHRCRLTMQRRWASLIRQCLLSLINMILHFCFPLFVHDLLSLVNMFPHICFASFLMNDEKLSLTRSMNICVTFVTLFATLITSLLPQHWLRSANNSKKITTIHHEKTLSTNIAPSISAFQFSLTNINLYNSPPSCPEEWLKMEVSVLSSGDGQIFHRSVER